MKIAFLNSWNIKEKCVRDSNGSPRDGVATVNGPTPALRPGARPKIKWHRVLICLTVMLMPCNVMAQFAPQAGLAGRLAMHKDSNAFVSWATSCTIRRGWLNIADTTLGRVTQGDTTYAFGKADGNTVSLGDAGEAIYYFANPINNGSGFDFAVFENGFRSPLDSTMAYLELATVAVSNNGVSYFPFHPTCNNDTAAQIAGAGEYMDARKLNNLAGKYILHYGVGFDLDELAPILSLDVDNIRYIKIKDVIGSLSEFHCTYDTNNHRINDPYPTPFPSGGFDLDALGVIHQKYPNLVSIVSKSENDILLYPNPANEFIYLTSSRKFKYYSVYNPLGSCVIKGQVVGSEIAIHSLPNGIYLLQLQDDEGKEVYKSFYKNE